MKRVLGLLLSVVGLASFVACGPEGEGLSSIEAKRVIIDENAANQEVSVPTDTMAVFQFEVIGGTGYLYSLDRNATFKVLYQEITQYEKGIVGGKGLQKIYVAGTAAGWSTLKFDLASPAGEIQGSKSYNAYSYGVFNANVKRPEAVAEIYEYDNSGIAVPATFSWCSEGVCPGIRNQGQCGSCWAFGTNGPLEVNIARANGGSAPDTSEQYLVSCNSDNWGCNGGWWAHDYNISKKISGESEAGAVSESDRPYTAKQDPCNSPNKKSWKAQSWAYIVGQSSIPTAAQMKQAIYDKGPISVAVYADANFQGYKGGIFQGSASGQVNHGISLVGWEANDVFILKNSWGTGWGEQGYMKIKYGSQSIGYGGSYIVYGGGGPNPTPTPTTSPTPTPTTSPTPTPPPPTNNSCQGKCEQKSGNCWCDSLCKNYGDCCSDYEQFCGDDNPPPTPNPTPVPPGPGTDSCQGKCGMKSGSCWCDTSCEIFKDCCADKKQFCG